jgi:hypothetical protein
MGNQIAGREMNQKRKKHIKSLVLIPALSGRPFAIKRAMRTKRLMRMRAEHVRMSFTLGHMLRNSTNTQLPPILA